MIPELIIFNHIPKTAGVSLGTALREHFDGDRIFAFSWMNAVSRMARLSNLSDAERNRIDLLLGHQPFGLQRLFHRPTHYIMMFRDPMERVLSHHSFLKNSDEFRLSKIYKNHKSLMWRKHIPLYWLFSDFQLRWLTNVFFGDPFDPEKNLTQAEKMLTHIHVGLVEEYHKSMKYFSRILGLELDGNIKENQTVNRKSFDVLDEETQQLIRQFNTHDLALYEIVKKRFQEQLSSLSL